MGDGDAGQEQGAARDVPASEGEGERLGDVLIAPRVLAQIVERTTLGVPGVAAMCSQHPRFDRLRGEMASGVHVTVSDETVSADIAIAAQADANILELGQRIQHEVSEALQHMVGMAAGEINVYVDEVRGRVRTR